MYVCAQGRCIFLRHAKRTCADIARIYIGSRQLFFQGNRNASAAGAYVENSSRSSLLVAQHINDPLYQLFRFGARDEHVLIYIPFHSEEPRLMQHILHRHMSQ